MMIGIGIDLIEINRFEKWRYYSQERLSRIFTEDEISYSFRNSFKTNERLASRFAAKEAFYKALSSCGVTSLPFLTICKAVQISRGGAPRLEVNTIMLNDYLPMPYAYNTIISMTHSKVTAGAVVILHS